MAEPDATAAPGSPAAPSGSAPQAVPTGDEFFGSSELPDADTFFSESEPDATQTLSAALPHGPLPFRLAQPFLPQNNEGWGEWLSSTPAGRIGSAFGEAFTGGGFSQAWDEGVVEQMRKWGVYNPAKEAHEANAAAYGFGIVRPALTSLRSFNQYLTRGLLDLPVVTMDILARTGEGLGAAIAKAGEEAEVDPVNRAFRTGALGRDVAGMIELAMTRGEIAPPLPHPVARGRANAVIGEQGGDAAYFGLREPSQADQRARAAAAADLPDPARAPFVADAADWGSRRLAALEAKASAGGQGEVWDLLTPVERAEYRFLRQNGRDGEMVLRGYPGLEEHLRERYQPAAEARPPELTAPVDAPTLARHLKPDLFRQWDNLEARRRDYFRWLDELADVRDRERVAAPSPEVGALDNKIADLERKVGNAGARTRERLQAELAAARAEREGVLDAQTADSPDMAQVRKRLVENDLRMRDMAVDVSAAMREANELLGQQKNEVFARETEKSRPDLLEVRGGARPEESAVLPGVSPGVHAPVETGAPASGTTFEPALRVLPETGARAAPEGGGEQPGTKTQEPIVSEDQRRQIEDDVYQRLVAAGRPVEQAMAEAQLWAEHILARAQRMEGALGSARQIHERETPTFRLGQARETPRRTARARELAQEIEPQPTFYSALVRGLEGVKQDKASGKDWAGVIDNLSQKGVKKEEVEWSGVKEWLAAQKGPVSKQALLDYIEANTPDVQVKVLGERPNPMESAPIVAARERLEAAGYSVEINPEDPSMVAFMEAASEEPDFLTSDELPANLQQDARRIEVAAHASLTPEQLLEDYAMSHPAQHQALIDARLTPEITHGGESIGFRDRFGVLIAGDDVALDFGLRDEARLAATAFHNAFRQHMRNPGAPETKFGEWVTPGGTNYRELLLTLPDTSAAKIKAANDLAVAEWNKFVADVKAASGLTDQQVHGYLDGIRYGNASPQGMNMVMQVLGEEEASRRIGEVQRSTAEFDRVNAESQKAIYRAGHFKEPNVLAHVRVNDRVGPNGERILHIEEVQSDWHQQGRQRGYSEQKVLYNTHNRVSGNRGQTFTSRIEAEAYVAGLPPRVRDNVVITEVPFTTDGVPNAPFKNTWQDLAIKQMLRYAADRGYDRITWTTGEQQVSRYTQALRKKVDEIHWEKTDKGVHLVGFKTGESRAVVDTHESENALSDSIGKAMADKILGDEAQSGVLKGDDITISKTWPALEYDKKIPKFMNTFGKKYGAKVEDYSIQTRGGLQDKAPEFREFGPNDAEGLEGAEDFPNGDRPRMSETQMEINGQIENVLLILDGRGLSILRDDGTEAFLDGDVFAYKRDRQSAARSYESLRTMWPDHNMWARATGLSGEDIKVTPPRTGATHVVHSMKITPEMRAAVQQGQSLFQPRRGSVTFQPGNLRPLIKLFADADASTVMHESSHVWLEELLRDAAHERAPAQVKADAETIHNWLGTRPGESIPVRAHEKFARGFERYLMEGVAPSRALVGIFEQFKAWLTAIYQRLTSLRSPINEDVRLVFDRMLSTEPQRAVIGAEMKAREGLGDAHEAVDRGMRRGPNATAAARRIRGERNAEIVNHHPEIADDLGLGGGTETPGGNGGAGALPDGGGAQAGAVAGEGGGLPAARAVGPGGGEFAPEGPSPRPAGARESGLYAKVPKQPRRLTELVKQHGGISDGGADLEGVLAAGRRGKGIIRPGGITMERMVELAKDEGYFPELGDRLPDTREFLAKLREDQHGGPQYSDFDRDEIAAYDAAMGQNSEVDRIASEYGVEVRKRMTQREFWDTVAERLSEEQAAKLAEEIDDSRAALVEEAERKAQEYIESRGEAWEPDLFYDRAEIRSLEDMENEHAAEQGLGGTEGRARGSAEAGPAGGAAGPLPADSGQGQRFSGSAGRGGSEGGAPVVSAPRREPGAVDPTDANARFADPEPELIDKAGNIRLDNLNAPEDVNAVLRAIAAEHEDFIGARRGVVSDTERMAYADALGVGADVADKNIDALRAMSVNDPYPLAARIEAARRLLIQSAADVHKAMAAAATGDDAALMAYAAARQRHINIQETLSGATAEWGRAGRAFHRLSGDKGAADAQALAELFQSAVGRTPDELRAEAQMGLALETPGQISNFLQAVRQPSFLQLAVEFFQTSALWNPKTWIANGAGSVLTLLTSSIVHPVAVGIGYARHLATGSQERAVAAEILPRLFGAIEGAKNGFRAARAVMKDEAFLDRSHSRSEFGFDFGEDARRRDVGGRRNLPGRFGVAMRYSYRIMGATDVVFKGIGYQQKLAELAANTAWREGLEGTALQARITNLLQSPTVEMRVAAKNYADYQTFNQDLQGISREFQSFAGKHPIIKLMGALFIRTPINILKYSAEHSILTPLVRDARAALSGSKGAIARDEALAKIAVGSAVSLATLAYVTDGTMTGGGPKDPRERAILMATGWRPYSVRIRGEYVPYSRLEPISTLIGVAADAAEIWHQMTERDSENVGMMIWGSVTQNLLNKQYMGSLSDFFEVMNDPVRYGENWTGRLLTGLVPSGIRHLGLAYHDPYLREASRIIDRVRSNAGFGSDLPVRRDIFGEPIRRDEAFGPDFASPFTLSPVHNDPVLREMERLEYFPSRPQKKIAGVDLTPQQYDDFCRIGGREAKARLDALVAEPGWSSIPGADRREIMRQTFQEARETARAQVIMESIGSDNDIEAKASQLKEELTRRYNEAE